MDETETLELPPVGEQLRAAREAKGLSLEDVATETRVPLRHLESLEVGDWSRLPAPTYTIGFAKSYASAIGLDRNEIGEQLRAEMGGYRSETGTQEVAQPVDPARAMPRWLIFSAIAAVIALILIFSWFQNRSISSPDESAPPAEQAPPPAQPQAQPQPQAAPPAAATGPVTISATAPAWLRVTDQGKTLYEGMMQPGQSYQVPPTATAPKLRAGAPEAIRINVGNAVAPPVGPAGKVASDVSLLPNDLMHPANGATAAPGAAPNPTAPPPASPPPTAAQQ
jgi:cytoskeletal protein RodZ